jgi:LmbE family N-acetylglucosaminyl deacetylase
MVTQFNSAPPLVHADELLVGTVLAVIPHADDEVLGCGEALSQVSDKTRLHFAYVSDNSRSPEPAGGDAALMAALRLIRADEARCVMSRLGVPEENVHFLGFPDGSLQANRSLIEARLHKLCKSVQPDTVLAPFRYDWHPDHLAVSRAASAVVGSGRMPARLLQYFVYHRLRLLPGRDIRAFLRPEHARQVHSEESSRSKRELLDCYMSQISLSYPWQRHPVLRRTDLEDVVSRPEFYFCGGPSMPDSEVFSHSARLISLLSALEPPLKRAKDQVVERLRFSKKPFDRKAGRNGG